MGVVCVYVLCVFKYVCVYICVCGVFVLVCVCVVCICVVCVFKYVCGVWCNCYLCRWLGEETHTLMRSLPQFKQ